MENIRHCEPGCNFYLSIDELTGDCLYDEVSVLKGDKCLYGFMELEQSKPKCTETDKEYLEFTREIKRNPDLGKGPEHFPGKNRFLR